MATTVTAAPTKQTGFKRVVSSPTFARILFPFVVLGVWYAIWAWLETTTTHNIFASPHQVAVFMWEEITLTSGVKYSSVAENLYVQFAISIARLTIGFLIAVFIGSAVGVAMGISKAVDAFFHDWVMAILAMPALVWALFLGLVFGFGHAAPILTVILAGIPFVIINVREGVRNTPKDLLDMGTAFGVSSRDRTRHVLLPSLMPFFFAGLRYAYSIGWKGLVIAEVFGSDRGMGWTIKFWYDAHRAHGVIGYALFFIIFAMTLEKVVFEPLAKKAFRWRPSLEIPELPEESFAEVVDQEFLIEKEEAGLDG